MRDSRSIWVLVVLLALLAAGLLTMLIEKTEITIPVPPTGRAAANDWYGVERLLSEQGVDATSAPGAKDLPPQDHVILLFARGQTSQQVERLLNWVEDGGHLIATMEPRVVSEAASDEVLELEDSDDEILAALELTSAEALAGALETVAVIPPQGGEALSVTAPEIQVKLSDWLPCLWTEAGAPVETICPMSSFVRVPYGDGWITLLPEASFLDNFNLGEHDNALFLWTLVQRGGPPAGALVVYRDQPPSLWALIGQHAWPLLVAGATLLALWLWSALPRFGPVLVDPPPARRSLVEHVLASGEHLWRREHQDLLLKSARRQVLRSTLGLGANDGKAGLAMIEAVSAETGASADEVREALYGGGTHDPDIFLRAMTALQRVRRGRKKPSTSEGSA